MSRTRHKHDKLVHAPSSLDTKSSRAIRFSRRSFPLLPRGIPNDHDRPTKLRGYCESGLNEMHFRAHTQTRIGNFPERQRIYLSNTND